MKILRYAKFKENQIVSFAAISVLTCHKGICWTLVLNVTCIEVPTVETPLENLISTKIYLLLVSGVIPDMFSGSCYLKQQEDCF